MEQGDKGKEKKEIKGRRDRENKERKKKCQKDESKRRTPIPTPERSRPQIREIRRLPHPQASPGLWPREPRRDPASVDAPSATPKEELGATHAHSAV